MSSLYSRIQPYGWVCCWILLDPYFFTRNYNVVDSFSIHIVVGEPVFDIKSSGGPITNTLQSRKAPHL